MSTISKLTISVELNALLQKIKQRIQEVKPSDVTEAAAQEILERLPIVRHLFDDLSEKNQTQLSKELLALTQEQIDQLLSVVELTRNELRWIQRQVSARSILPTIEYILKKRDKLSPQLFRPEPVWSDYESGYVVEREEVDTIISRLKQQGAQLVIGKPASGKSIILKHVGYKLSQQGKTVYFIDVKTHSKELLSDYIFNRVPNVLDNNAVVIVDDSHLQARLCADLISEHELQQSGAHLIVGIRERSGVLPSPFESLESLHISAIDIADSMIDLYLKKQRIAPDLQTSTLLDKNLASYKNDLFWLSRALESCDAQTGYVDDYLIYKTIFKKLTHFSLRDHELLDIGNTLLPIAYFFQFELPVEASFLIKELELQKESINALINLGELKRHYDEQRGEMLYLPHSSSAKIYLETFRHYPGLGRTLIESICEKSNQDNWERGLTSLALKRDPVHVALDLLYAEERDPLNGVFYIDEEEEEIAGFITLLKECLNKNDYIELIKRAIRIENDIDALAGFMRAVVELNPSVAESLFEAVVIRLERENFERCEAFLDKFAVWSEAVEYNTPTLGKLIAKLVGPTLAKASVPDHVSKIGGQIKEIIHPDDWEKRDNVAPFRDDVFNAVLASIVAIVDAEEDVSVIEQYIETVNSSLDFDLSDEDTIYYEMLNAIDHDRLIKIINNERDTQKILSLLDAIGDRNEDVFEKLFSHLSVVVKHEFEKANALVD